MKKVRSKKMEKEFAAVGRVDTNQDSLTRRYQEICALRRKLKLAAARRRRAK